MTAGVIDFAARAATLGATAQTPAPAAPAEWLVRITTHAAGGRVLVAAHRGTRHGHIGDLGLYGRDDTFYCTRHLSADEARAVARALIASADAIDALGNPTPPSAA